MLTPLKYTIYNTNPSPSPSHHGVCVAHSDSVLVKVRAALGGVGSGLGGSVGVSDQWEDGANGDDSSLRDACHGINRFLSVFIHISLVYGPYVKPNK